MEDIEEFFRNLISEHHSIDIAESEFKRAIAEDPDLKAAYHEWCEENGSSERNGFRDFCDEYRDQLDQIWESLTDYDAE